MLPDIRLIPELILSAVAIGIIGLVQAAGVSQGYANPDGKFPDPDGDYAACANRGWGFFGTGCA